MFQNPEIFVKRCQKFSHHQIISGTRAGLGNLQRIYWRAKPHEAVDAYPETNFVLGHEQWVPKEWVLKVFLSFFFLPKVIFNSFENFDLKGEREFVCDI